MYSTMYQEFFLSATHTVITWMTGWTVNGIDIDCCLAPAVLLLHAVHRIIFIHWLVFKSFLDKL